MTEHMHGTMAPGASTKRASLWRKNITKIRTNSSECNASDIGQYLTGDKSLLKPVIALTRSWM